jgi:hypothetical protein
MMITKKSLPRRTFLRGMGVAVALPLLDAMVPALSAMAKTAARPVRRLGFIYIPNGAVMDQWTPTGDGPAFEFSPILSPLAPFRDRLTIVTGLSQKQAESLGDGGGDHSRAPSTWLSGVHIKKAEGADIFAGTTVDQLAARELGKSTRVPSIELALDAPDLVGICSVGYSCAYQNTISWRTPTTPLPMENNPRLVFEQLFGEGGRPEDRLTQAREDRSILDSVINEVRRLQTALGPGDRAKVTQYLEAIRDIEGRIQKAEEQSATNIPLPGRPLGIPTLFEEHAKLMFDLQVLAYQADVTRVASMLMGREETNRTYNEIGVPDPHHSTSHHQDDPVKLAKLTKINTFHVQLLAYYLDKLRSVADGDQSLLDSVMVVYGGGISDGNLHDHVNLPLLVAGGGGGRLKGGRHLRCPKYTPMCNLLVSLLDKVDAPAEQFGDSTGSLEHLDI